MPDGPPFVVVSGPPASGKSTLAPVLAERLHLPLLAKDIVKEAVLTTLGADTIDESRRLGRASVAVLYGLAAASPVGAVVESVFVHPDAADELRRLPGRVVEVFCRCDRETARRRYAARARIRAAGHFDADRTDDELWNEQNASPVAGGWPVIEVDTTATVPLDDVVERIRASLARPSALG